MIEARAVVTRAESGEAWVRIDDRPGGCGRCDEPGGCRSTGLAYALKAPDKVFRLPNRIGAEAGDAVRIRIDDGAPLRGALLGYGLGVVLLLAGAALGTAFAAEGQGDLFALTGGVGGLVAAVGLNRFALRSTKLRQAFDVEMVREPASCGHQAGTSS
ncbi:SoxR reducing system RseC family protein [Aromatoleum anaerobium]|uniref:Fis family transcriptional regulator n=1 Tax=Aromatoleum anaerobium TaxID=182180 RepID=A0ABX1PIU0_9RHOO|nr:SoxR reducing system RseC family protein [Aromatoleum anaerobium]MCK0505653.1 SoxR reducing system RseC family protein [Aromatoleum anaerobium]